MEAGVSRRPVRFLGAGLCCCWACRLARWRWSAGWGPRWSGGGVDCRGPGPRRSGAGRVASLARPGEGRLRGLPRLLAAAAALADVLGDGPLAGDDLLRLGGGDRVAVVVADHIGGATVQYGPGPFGQVPGDDAAGREMGGAALGHLLVVDP